MLKKIGQGLALAELKVKNSIYKFLHEEKGGTEIVAILLIIIILIAVVVIFKKELIGLIENLFKTISEDVDKKLQ